MEYLSAIINLPIAQLMAIVFVVIILQKAGIDIAGILKSVFKANNKENGNGKMAELQTQLNTIEGNHLHTIEAKIDKLDDKLDLISERVARVEVKINDR